MKDCGLANSVDYYPRKAKSLPPVFGGLAFDRARFDAVFGTGNWTCLPDYSFGVKITYLSSPLAVEYPFTVVDAEDSTRYGVGEAAPSGGRATVWLGGSIPRDQCP